MANDIFADRNFFMSANIIIDWGNTLVKLARFEQGELVEHIQLTAPQYDEISTWMGCSSESKVLICSVSSNSDKVEKQLQREALFFLKLTHQTPVPLEVNYHTPETLGYDRLANAVAAGRLREPGHHALAIDAGTCLKFDFVHAEKGYVGGAISPGLRMRYHALHEQTDALPLLDEAQRVALIGQSTHESMHSGVVNGMLAEIREIIRQYRAEFPECSVFLTGGDASFFEEELKNHIFAHPFLTRIGLNDILEFNQNR